MLTVPRSDAPNLEDTLPPPSSLSEAPGLLNNGNRSSVVERVVVNNQQGHQRTRQIQDPRGTNPASAQKTGCCNGDFVKMIAVAAALASLVVGAAGLLVYLGKLQISWAGAGAISQQMGLYIMLGGLGLSAILTILLTINKCCMNRSSENARQQRQLNQQQQQLNRSNSSSNRRQEVPTN